MPDRPRPPREPRPRAPFRLKHPKTLAALFALAGEPGEHFYRGLIDASFELTPRVARNPNHLRNEWNLMSAFGAAARAHGYNLRNNLELLALAQHHGLPTRLMDVTSAFGVALYFAVQTEAPDRDVIVWRIDIARMIDAMCRWYGQRSPSGSPVTSDYTEFPAPPRLVDGRLVPVVANHEIDQVLDGYMTDGSEVRQPPLIISTPHISQRITAQDASFLVLDPLGGPLGQQLLALDARQALTGIVIGPPLREMVRQHLRTIGLGRRLLFPDIDNLARDLTERYAENT
ncbi:MAG: FRG domain-containing protein [Burkholderiaceae bacterium]|nr:FRG domain-containing protein [Burkholderiaceae bacterium]